MNQPDTSLIPGEWARGAQQDRQDRTAPERLADDGRAFSILVVCTGNICRSPLAQQLLAASLAPTGMQVSITSAGTRALVGHPMTPEAAELSLLYGGDPAAHVARQLTPEMVENADLILTATRDHRGDVVQISPATTRRAFTLRQFARIVSSGVETEGSRAAGTSPRSALQFYVAAVAASRGFVPPPLRPGDDDVEDPFRRSKQVYRRSGAAVHEAVAVISAGLASAVHAR